MLEEIFWGMRRKNCECEKCKGLYKGGTCISIMQMR